MRLPAWWRFCPNSVFTFSLRPPPPLPPWCFGVICVDRAHTTNMTKFHFGNNCGRGKSQSRYSWNGVTYALHDGIIWASAFLLVKKLCWCHQGARHTPAWLLISSQRFGRCVQLWALGIPLLGPNMGIPLFGPNMGIPLLGLNMGIPLLGLRSGSVLCACPWFII